MQAKPSKAAKPFKAWNGSGKTTSRPAFTLIELLVVIGIIGVLVALVLVVGGRMVSGGREDATRSILQTLDQALQAYKAEKLKNPDAIVEVPEANTFMPVVDGVDDRLTPIDSIAWFLLQVQRVPAAEQALQNVNSRFIRPSEPHPSITLPATLRFNTIVDAWGRPIRYVHPALDGRVNGPDPRRPSDVEAAVDLVDLLGEKPRGSSGYAVMGVRRSESLADKKKDADLGVCPNEEPYFYSCGPDGDPGTTNDNVYVTKPKFKQ